jgi:hypothetical protein
VSIAVFAGIIGNAILYGVSLFASFLGWKDPLNILFLNLPIWTVLLTVLPITVLVYVVRSRSYDGMNIGTVKQRPGYNTVEGVYPHFSVDWHFVYGSFAPYSERYVFCKPNPFCPKCECEMGPPSKQGISRQYYWKCERCGKTYKTPKNHPLDAWETVEKLAESDIRTGRMKLSHS